MSQAIAKFLLMSPDGMMKSVVGKSYFSLMEQIFGRCTFHNVLLKICSIWNFSVFHYFAAPCTDNILYFVNVLLCLLPCMGVNFRYIYIYIFLILSFCPFCSCCDDSFLSDGLLVLIISFLQIKTNCF